MCAEDYGDGGRLSCVGESRQPLLARRRPQNHINVDGHPELMIFALLQYRFVSFTRQTGPKPSAALFDLIGKLAEAL
jgi:hypothetical protein